VLNGQVGVIGVEQPKTKGTGSVGHRAPRAPARGKAKALGHPARGQHSAFGAGVGRLNPADAIASVAAKCAAVLLRITFRRFPPPTTTLAVAPGAGAPMRGNFPRLRRGARCGLTPSLSVVVGGNATDARGAWAEFPLDPLPPGAAELRPAAYAHASSHLGHPGLGRFSIINRLCLPSSFLKNGVSLMPPHFA
jgi:hypothetical protein